MTEQSYFKVYFSTQPEWGRSYDEFTKYFVCESIETLKGYLSDAYNVTFKGAIGKHYFSMDRCEQIIEVEELIFEEVKPLKEREQYNEY